MATRGRIGVLRPDGRVESIYNHYDSYPDTEDLGLGAALARGFNDPKLIDELIALGNRRGLYREGENKQPYDWHNKEDLFDEPSRFDNDENAFFDNDKDWDIDYKYLYKNGEWFVKPYGEEPRALIKPGAYRERVRNTQPNLRRRFKSPLDQANDLLGK